MQPTVVSAVSSSVEAVVRQACAQISSGNGDSSVTRSSSRAGAYKVDVGCNVEVTQVSSCSIDIGVDVDPPTAYHAQ